MPLDLPVPDERQLARSPLALTVCQVRFEEVLAVSEARTMRMIYEELGGRNGPYPKVDSQLDQQLSIQVGEVGAGAASHPVRTGWRFQSSDEQWIVSIMPEHVGLQTTAYTNWASDFRPRLEKLIEVINKHIAPDVERRLGLRYVDRITEPSVNSAQEWHDYIAPELLGLVLHDRLGPSVTAAQQQVDLDLGDGAYCALRHGFFSATDQHGKLTYVLDFDIHRLGVYAFDPEDIMATADRFNRVALQLFQQAITPKMLAWLHGSRKDQE